MHPNFPDSPTSPFFEEIPTFPGINIPTLEVVALGSVIVAGALAVGTITLIQTRDREINCGVIPKCNKHFPRKRSRPFLHHATLVVS